MLTDNISVEKTKQLKNAVDRCIGLIKNPKARYRFVAFSVLNNWLYMFATDNVVLYMYKLREAVIDDKDICTLSFESSKALKRFLLKCKGSTSFEVSESGVRFKHCNSKKETEIFLENTNEKAPPVKRITGHEYKHHMTIPMHKLLELLDISIHNVYLEIKDGVATPKVHMGAVGVRNMGQYLPKSANVLIGIDRDALLMFGDYGTNTVVFSIPSGPFGAFKLVENEYEEAYIAQLACTSDLMAKKIR